MNLKRMQAHIKLMSYEFKIDPISQLYKWGIIQNKLMGGFKSERQYFLRI